MDTVKQISSHGSKIWLGEMVTLNSPCDCVLCKVLLSHLGHPILPKTGSSIIMNGYWIISYGRWIDG